jgi:hypothetical protein
MDILPPALRFNREIYAEGLVSFGIIFTSSEQKSLVSLEHLSWSYFPPIDPVVLDMAADRFSTSDDASSCAVSSAISVKYA